MIVVNNLTFAMTGGQVAPTTLVDLRTSTTPYGNQERPFDICKLVVAAGGTFVARSTTQRPRQVVGYIRKALRHAGFSLVEIISQCPTNFGRRAIGSGDPAGGIEWIKERTITIDAASDLTEEELVGRFVTGIFADCSQPVFRGSSVWPGCQGG